LSNLIQVRIKLIILNYVKIVLELFGNGVAQVHFLRLVKDVPLRGALNWRRARTWDLRA
jgi:hypothetical protein